VTRRVQKLIDTANERKAMLRDLNASNPSEWAAYRIAHNDWTGHRNVALAAIAEELGLR
jgi:hypothetical protein